MCLSVCLCVCVCVCVCVSAHNSGTGKAIVYKFSGQLQGTPGMVFGAKIGVVGRGPDSLHFEGEEG